MRNLKKFYYKDYFRSGGKSVDFSYLLKKEEASGDTKKAIKANNDSLCREVFTTSDILPKNEMVNKSIPLNVAYPGLVTGVGISHQANIEGEFKLGLHFDHTSGQPVVYGSSVKGVLKHYLEEVYEGPLNIDDLKNDIFEGNGKSVYCRDIFFDAVIVKSNNKDGRILASDSITPHSGGPLKDPIPLTFVKIASGCTLEFRFRLVDSVIDGKTVTVKEKLQIFSDILTTYGVGAKTNVGYGQLEAAE